MPPASHPHQVLGIAFKVASTLAFAAMAALVKLLSDTIPVGELTFFRSFFALVPVLVWVAFREDMARVFHTRQLRLHLLRSLSGTIAMFLGFTGLSLLPFADATAIGYAAPLLMVVFAVVFLGEKVRIYRWSAVVAGLTGILVILSEYLLAGGERPAVGALIAVAGATFAAGAATMARVIVRQDSAASTVAHFSAFVAVASLFTVPFGWAVPTWPELGLLVMIGILGGVGQVLLTTSFRFGDASTIAPFDYVSMIWVLVISFFVFGTFPTPTVLVGTAIVIGAGLFVIYREHRLGLERAEAKRAQTPTTPLS